MKLKPIYKTGGLTSETCTGSPVFISEKKEILITPFNLYMVKNNLQDFSQVKDCF